MRLIDGDHLKKWILQRWEKAYSNEDLPTREVSEQIDREISYKMIDVAPQPRKGLWIDIKHTFMTKCSVCDWINNDDSSYNFCPCCGADMREGDAE